MKPQLKNKVIENKSGRRQSFRKIVGDDNAVFFSEHMYVETEEIVWKVKVPKNGDLVELKNPSGVKV